MDTNVDVLTDTSRHDIKVLRSLSSLDSSRRSIRDSASGADSRVEIRRDKEGVLLSEGRDERLEGAVGHDREPDGRDDLGEVLRRVRVALEHRARLLIGGLDGGGELGVIGV